mmetsp:Transcript_49897/g.99305  ORF Transcript_49897/g.99305 Transcript_49897/m.99305 type:complete len:163 (-) Transcript_49897:333-821(-)|eukprot:CAMPEP_0174726540 /NCGR_PEP_ID=MMETSP1094-20130205/48026_1 /TAXON_ID=156173 /ORGANISM="Chrysochromulina brevifilum, Strain UTEX LB 985" /LENGTH=162 /DNA_ID=CAMNT_0015928137 /DNA_START=27 /DNA_END=515 /DNA_ORIENTATION=+
MAHRLSSRDRNKVVKQVFDDSRDMRLAAAKGELDTLRAEIARGADLNLSDPDSGFSALHYAALQGQVESVQILIEAGAKLSQYTNPAYSAGSSCTPLDYAKKYVHPKESSRTRHPEIVELLLKAGAEEGIYVEPKELITRVGDKQKVKQAEAEAKANTPASA